MFSLEPLAQSPVSEFENELIYIDDVMGKKVIWPPKYRNKELRFIHILTFEKTKHMVWKLSENAGMHSEYKICDSICRDLVRQL